MRSRSRDVDPGCDESGWVLLSTGARTSSRANETPRRESRSSAHGELSTDERARTQDWTPESGAKSSTFKGSNGSLGKRANKMKTHGVLTIRFEMPFNVRCGACEHMIAKGVRFNAEKRKVGNYYSTPIWSFTMRSPCCSHEIVIQTDPAKTEYVVTKGAERSVGYGGLIDEEESENAMQLLEYQNEAERAASSTNPMALLESKTVDAKKVKANAKSTFDLNRVSKARWKHDYDANKSLRRSMRNRRKEEHALRDRGRALGLPDHVKLKPEREEDRAYARRVFNASIFKRRQREKRKDILTESIFDR